MIFPIQQIIFFVFAVLLLLAALNTILVRNPVYAVLSLVLAFFASAALWMLLQAEFLSLVLIFVYVGAVMTLFLFVVMMLNIDITILKKKFVRYLPLGILFTALLIFLLVMSLSPQHFAHAKDTLANYGLDYNSTRNMGTLLFTQYLLPFEIAGVILFVAMVAAISLAFHGRKEDTRSQRIDKQLGANKKNRLRVVNMKSEQL